jgi:hypothetical protein
MTPLNISFFLTILFGNILSFWIKGTLKANGFQTKIFRHSMDSRNMFDLARSTNNKTLKQKCYLLLLGELLVLVILIALSILIGKAFLSE